MSKNVLIFPDLRSILQVLQSLLLTPTLGQDPPPSTAENMRVLQGSEEED